MANAEVVATSPPSLRTPTVQSMVVLTGLGLLALDGVLVAAKWAGAPFRWWLADTAVVIGALVVYLVLLGAVVDMSLIAVGLIRGRASAYDTDAVGPASALDPWRRYGFFSLGLWPVGLSAIAAYFVVATSNVTQISLTLVGTTTSWRDPLLWRLESGLHEWVVGLDFPVAAWDALYHNAWTVEASALFVLILLSRRQATVLGFLLSFVLLFYVGRLLGLLNPVMGPAFFRPELYGYLDGSLTADIQRLLARLIEVGPGATWQSGILMGGISAMPSLHVGLVATCVYWLAVARPGVLLVGVPWVLLVWTSTVVLGWHYAVDGLGGLLTAWLCIACTRRVIAVAGLEVPERLIERVRAARAAMAKRASV